MDQQNVRLGVIICWGNSRIKGWTTNQAAHTVTAHRVVKTIWHINPLHGIEDILNGWIVERNKPRDIEIWAGLNVICPLCSWTRQKEDVSRRLQSLSDISSYMQIPNGSESSLPKFSATYFINKCWFCMCSSLSDYNWLPRRVIKAPRPIKRRCLMTEEKVRARKGGYIDDEV